MPTKYFYEPYYAIYAKAKLLRIVNEKIRKDLEVLLNNDKTSITK